MTTYRTSFKNNPNIGLYAYCRDSLLLVGKEMRKNELKIIKKATNLEPINISIAGTSLIGVFLSGNSRVLLVPQIAFKYEIDSIKKLRIPCEVIDVIPTSLGNNIVCNDNGAIVSTEFSKDEVNKISKLLGVKTVQMDIADTTTPGAVIVLNGKYGVIHNKAKDSEIKAAEKILKVKLERATVNMGSPFLRSGIICNKHGLVVGGTSGGPEIMHLEECLGYHKQ